MIEAGYNVSTVVVDKDLAKLLADLTPRPDVVFNNLHGTGGEDGVIQGVLEMLGLPYTHSGVLASSIAMDKPMTKLIAATVGVPSPEGVVCSVADLLQAEPIARPYVAKPACEGSSVGVRIVMPDDNHQPIDVSEWDYGTELLVEKYIPGRELTVAVLDGVPQAVTEIVSHARFFDYEAKYHDTRTEYVCPAQIAPEIEALALEYAAAVYKVLGCNGLARCDFRFDDTKGNDGIFFLEINTQPGMTPESIGPSQVIRNGKSFSDLCAHLVETALCRNAEHEKALSSKDAKALRSA